VEGKREYTSLIYLPTEAPFDLWQRDGARGLKLYVRRVFIMDDAEQFLPLYLRFVKGVLDSADLPLNVSRELLQADSEVEAMRGALTRRVLEMLAKLAKDDAAKYQGFWREFGDVFKEGLAEDHSNRDKLLPLLRFASTSSGDEERDLTRAYVARMQTGQDKIYYVVGESLRRAQPPGHRGRCAREEPKCCCWGGASTPGSWTICRISRASSATRPVAISNLAPWRVPPKGKAEARLGRQSLLKRVKDSLGERVSEGARRYAAQGLGCGARGRRTTCRHPCAARSRPPGRRFRRRSQCWS
jgi:hypothetical protein